MKRILITPLFLLGLYPSPAFPHDGTIDVFGNGATTTTPGQRIRRGRGHDRDKESLQSGDIIQGIYGRGYNGSAFTTSDRISIELQTNEAWTTTANGTQILFKVTPITTATPATVGQIDGNGAFLKVYTSTAPRTALAMGSLTFAVGTLVFNSTDSELCVATGTVQTSFIQVSTFSVSACRH